MSQFGEILSNEKNIRHFGEALKQGKLSHAYLICGKKGSGKKTFTDNITAGLLCETDGVLPCGKCPGCIKVISDNHPDLRRVRHKKEGLISVEEIREQVVEDIIIKPYYGPYKIYIIEDADLMSVSAQNALLKTIEEPPEYGLIFLLTANPDGILETIHSRCMKMDMDIISDAQIENELKKRGNISEKRIKQIIKFARGNVGRAFEFADETGMSKIVNETAQLLGDIDEKSAYGIFLEAQNFEKKDAAYALDAIYTWYRDVLICKIIGDSPDIYFADNEKAIRVQAEKLSYEDIDAIFSAIDAAQDQINANVKVEAAVEALLLKIRQGLLKTA